jgi:hypothetical protein
VNHKLFKDLGTLIIVLAFILICPGATIYLSSKDYHKCIKGASLSGYRLKLFDAQAYQKTVE